LNIDEEKRRKDRLSVADEAEGAGINKADLEFHILTPVLAAGATRAFECVSRVLLVQCDIKNYDFHRAMDFVRTKSSLHESPLLTFKIVVALDSWHFPRPGGQK
jgi:hypothetical protein